MAPPRIKARPLDWTPHLQPVVIASATPEQLIAMQVTPSATKVSNYVRTLVHDPESYVARTTLFNTIMYIQGGLSRADRELGALGASLVNGCKYCTFIHAGRHASECKSSDVIYWIWTGNRDKLSQRDAAILAFAEALSTTPISATADHIEALRAAGLSASEISDLIHAIAIFCWANRLMHPLGSATLQSKQK
nr:peroxidase-related enzyme [Falsihalocynthiibacter arcticus]